MKIRIAPLDWGLGHATRCIPLVRALQAQGHEIRLTAAGPGMLLFQREFPGLPIDAWQGYGVRYPKNPRWLFPFLVLQLPRIFSRVVREHLELRKLVRLGEVDAVISDCRFGLFHPRVPCFMLTHQLFLRLPASLGPLRRPLEKGVYFFHAAFLRRFQEVWIPDVSGENSLSGELAHGKHGLPHVRYIGPLSRFHSPSAGDTVSPSARIQVVAVLSGTEPQRSLFEKELLSLFKTLDGTRVLIRGKPSAAPASCDSASAASENPSDELPRLEQGELHIFDHLPTRALEDLLLRAEIHIARSGYSTVMDFHRLRLKGILFVPTPNQTEQEYLAAFLCGHGVANSLAQSQVRYSRNAVDAARFNSGFSKFQPFDPSTLRDFLAGHPLLHTE